MNIEHSTSNVEWEKMKKQTYDLEERLLKEKMNIEHRTSNIECWMRKDEETEFQKPELLDDILQETEELIKIFVTSIKTAEKKQK